MNTGALLVLTTFPDATVAGKVVRSLVEERLVACGNLLPRVESIYRWKGAVETGIEVAVLLKTDKRRWRLLKKRLRAQHPYEVPEIVAIEIAEALPEYLGWIFDSCRPLEGDDTGAVKGKRAPQPGIGASPPRSGRAR